MGACKSQRGGESPAVQQQRREPEPLRHGGTGTVQTQIGGAAVLDGEGRGDALVQEIAAEDDVRPLPVRLVHAAVDAAAEHGDLRLLPTILPEVGVRRYLVKALFEGSRPLLAAYNRRVGDDAGLVFQRERLLSDPFCHMTTPFVFA